jgi:hypothetical protein
MTISSGSPYLNRYGNRTIEEIDIKIAVRLDAMGPGDVSQDLYDALKEKLEGPMRMNGSSFLTTIRSIRRVVQHGETTHAYDAESDLNWLQRLAVQAADKLGWVVNHDDS